MSFSHGTLGPDLTGHEQDRLADLDDYNNLLSRLGPEWDLVVVDGLKRSRCLLEARDLLAPRGYAMRHDAWHKHYQCAFPAFTSGRRIGDEWWIDTGMYTDCTDFTAVVPWHAPERNAALPQ